MNLILCGLPRCGKSTIGKLVAAKVNWNFIDTDILIENSYEVRNKKKSSCRQIFLEEGESKFRELEKEQIASLKETSIKCIIAVGGGALNDQENTHLLQCMGKVVYLESPLTTLWERIKVQPVLPTYLDPEESETSFFNIANLRIPCFEQAANFSINTHNISLEVIVEKIINLLALHRVLENGK
jgi:shikimate kinase